MEGFIKLLTDMKVTCQTASIPGYDVNSYADKGLYPTSFNHSNTGDLRRNQTIRIYPTRNLLLETLCSLFH